MLAFLRLLFRVTCKATDVAEDISRLISYKDMKFWIPVLISSIVTECLFYRPVLFVPSVYLLGHCMTFVMSDVALNSVPTKN